MFSPDDRQALARSEQIRRAARELVERIHRALSDELRRYPDHRLSKVREDSDRLGLFVYLPPLGNVWGGVQLEGPESLTFRFEAPADRLVPSRRLEEAGLSLERPHWVARLDLVGEGEGDAARAKVVEALARWIDACHTVASGPR